MKIRLLSLFLIGSITGLVFLSSCRKEDDNSKSSTGESVFFTDSRDNRVYKSVKIGEQVWMAENLAYTGIGLQHITNKTDWENNLNYDAWCYYENNENYGNTYGVLYQWEAAKLLAQEVGIYLPMRNGLN